MTLKHLLVHVDSGPRSAERLDLALALARRFGARLAGLFAESASLGPSIVGRRSREDYRKAMEEARAAFEAKARAAEVSAEWWDIDPSGYADLVELTAVCCRYADLAIFGQHLPDDERTPEDLVEHALLNGGRPVLVVPWAGRYAHAGRRVLVAWNGSREAARALNDAIPLMEGAEAVTVLAFQQLPEGRSAVHAPQLDVVAHLAAHGITARYERMTKEAMGEGTVVDVLLNRAFELDADLTVMGGYRQYGFPFLRRGGSAQAILRSMLTPVLLSQ